jgi:thiamine biosynthesis lipoprotein
MALSCTCFCRVVILLMIAGCGGREDPFRRETVAMDTFLSVTIYDEGVEEQTAFDLSGLAFHEITAIESLATDYSDGSEVGRINLAAGKNHVRVSDETESLIRESALYSEVSMGAFDITIGPLVRAWDFMSPSPAVPDGERIARLLPLVDYRQIKAGEGEVFLEKPGMRLDLGGIAKGYAVDRAIDELKERGLRQFIVDLGGNLGVYWQGTRMLDSTRVTIFVRHPRRSGEMFAHFDVGSCGVSTSGDYQRYFMTDGVRYHHLLDPRTGFPARDLVSVTIVAGNAIRADALSTSVFVLGREKGMGLIEELPDVEGMLIYGTGDSLSVDVSSGLRGKVALEGMP